MSITTRPSPEYHRAVAGNIPGPSETRFREMGDWTNYPKLRRWAVKRIYQAVRFNQGQEKKPRVWESAMDYLERRLLVKWPEEARHLSSTERRRIRERLVNKAASLAIDEARMSHLYYGVDDPILQGYCSFCKGPQPKEKFTRSIYTCDDCFTSREGKR